MSGSFGHVVGHQDFRGFLLKQYWVHFSCPSNNRLLDYYYTGWLLPFCVWRQLDGDHVRGAASETGGGALLQVQRRRQQLVPLRRVALQGDVRGGPNRRGQGPILIGLFWYQFRCHIFSR